MSETEHLKHLEMIQAVVTRMAQNSFVIKGWAVTLVAGILALAADDHDLSAALLAVGPALVFGVLDAHYLAQERRYRRHYDDVRAGRPGGERLAMDAARHAATETVTAALSSWSVWPLYAALLAMILGVAGRLFAT